MMIESHIFFDERAAGRLKLVRQYKMLSIEKTAHEIGVSFNQYKKYEKGETRISFGRLCVICRIFGVTPDFFWGSGTLIPSPPASPAPNWTNTQFDLNASKRLLQARRNSRKSTHIIAQSISVSDHQYDKYERGYNRMSFGRLSTLAKFLHLTPDYFWIEHR